MADRVWAEIQAPDPARPFDTPAARMKEYPNVSPPVRDSRARRRTRRRKAKPTANVNAEDPPQPAPLNLVARNGPFPHIQVIPKPSVEATPERRMQRTNPFTFKKLSFSEEAEAKLSSYSKPYSWQANLANASDGSSFAQKARAAELNAARARRAAQMQSIDDEIPDLSGPVYLGMYKFTRRGRGSKDETHRLIELESTQDKEGETKMTETAPTLSPHPLFNLPPSTTLSSSQLPGQPTYHTRAEHKDRIFNCFNNPNPDRRGFHEPGPPQFDGSTQSAPNPFELVRSIYTNTRSSQASGEAKPSKPLAQDLPTSQYPDNPDTSSWADSSRTQSSFPPECPAPILQLTTTINPARQSSQSDSKEAGNPFELQGLNLGQAFNVCINPEGQSPQTSRQAHPSFPPSDRHTDTSQEYDQFANDLTALIKPKERSSKASEEASDLRQTEKFQRPTATPFRKIEVKADTVLQSHRRSSQANSQAHLAATPKGHALPKSLPLSDKLLTASFNLETNEWDPDSPEANMSAQTPTNKPTRGGHSGQQSSGKSSSQVSYASQDARNPYAIVTTTKSGRPYTNPYMPIYTQPSAAPQSGTQSSPGHLDAGTQSGDAEIIQRHRKTRYIDQEEARYRALEQSKYGQVKESLDDPFQDLTLHTQPRADNQPSNYAEYAVNQTTYGHLLGYQHQPSSSINASDHVASSFLNVQGAKHAPDSGLSLSRGQPSAYEQQPVINNIIQNPGSIALGQRPDHEKANRRASVRLPAVRGTTEPHKPFPSEEAFRNLSLDHPTSRNAQDPRHRQAQGGIQQSSERVSHAVPIRDPAAYTGSGLTSRRNQEALRQNLNTVVASSQLSTGTARTVMNDPQRERQLSDRHSPAATDTTGTGSTLRAQAPSYEFVNTQRLGTTNPSFRRQNPDASQRQGRPSLEGRELPRLQTRACNFLRDNFPTLAVPPGFDYDTASYTMNAGLPVAAIGAGNTFMKELVERTAPKQNSQQSLESSTMWFRHDPRDLEPAAKILSYDAMNRMNAKEYPLKDISPRTVGQLADESLDDGLVDRARQAVTPRPIGHGRPAGFATPSRLRDPSRATPENLFSSIAGATSANDAGETVGSGRNFFEDHSRALEAMFGAVYSNLVVGREGPPEYMKHYCDPPAYAIDHNARNKDTLFDPQWFATAPPARVGRDPRREQSEYEDPTQGNAGRRGDHARADVIRHDSGGRGSGGPRVWNRN